MQNKMHRKAEINKDNVENSTEKGRENRGNAGELQRKVQRNAEKSKEKCKKR